MAGARFRNTPSIKAGVFHNVDYVMVYSHGGGFKDEVRLANDTNGLSLARKLQ